jgi:ATP-dependent Lon protease
VILLDEVDKINQSYHGDPAAALLEVLDPEQNNTFSDHYLDLPFDLSEVLFVCTANTTSTIPAALLDRMEVIELSGYTLEEKEQITKRFILPKVLESAGMTASTIRLPRMTIRAIIQDYAREPGLRVLQQQIEKLARKVASKIVERRESREKLKLPLTIEAEDLRTWLGPKRFLNEVAERAQEPGVGIGLAWTPMGGEILFIETTDLPGTGQMKLTGQMGDVMQESAALAWTFVKRRLFQECGITQSGLKDKDFHLHLPAGAVPKDGPSAGITLAATLYSLITGRKMRPFWAMTGELSLTGKVLPVGGVKEKLLAARRSGIKDVIIPDGNKKDLEDLPVELLKQLRIHPVKMVDEVFGLALEQGRKPAGQARLTYSKSDSN